MNNKEIKYAIDYHEETKHSQLTLQMSRHYLDWDNKPLSFKVYPDLPPIPLPQDFPKPDSDALTCIRGINDTSPSSPQLPLDIHALGQILFFSAGTTREVKFDSGTYYMRAASATGALYPIELYVVSNDTSGLEAGVYHFCPGDFSLTKLRSGDYTPQLAAAAGNNAEILSSPVTLALTSLAWRNAWKYEDRSYRHWFWDSGVIAANLLAVAISAGLKPSLVMGFVDSAVNNLLCLEQRKEAAVVLAPMGSTLAGMTGPSDLKEKEKMEEMEKEMEEMEDMKMKVKMKKPDNKSIPEIANPRFLPLSERETEHPEIWKIHEASNLATSQQVAEWLSNSSSLQKRVESETHLLDRASDQSDGIGDVILRRSSSRRFARSKISQAQLLTVLHSSTRGVPADFLGEGGSLVDIYFMANAVEGVAPGRYFYNRHTNSMEQLGTMKETASRKESGYLCLGQNLFADASAVFFMMADLHAILKALGNRGYRACEFEAGVVAGKIYLSSYAQGLGASGSTFFDDAVAESFSPHAKDKATMLAVGVGTPAYKARPGKILPVRLSRSELAAIR